MQVFLKINIAFLLIFISSASYSFTLENTYWEKVGKEKNVSPYLLYAIAIKETMLRVNGTDGKFITPSLWAMNSPSTKGMHFDSKEALLKKVKKLRSKGVTNIDIGVMQLNYRWQKHRVKSIYDLADPYTNIRTGATVLKEELGNTEDIILGIGHYHNPGKKRAFKYGYHVLEIYIRLVNYANVYSTDYAFDSESAKSIDNILRTANRKRPTVTNLIISSVDAIERDLQEALANLQVAKNAVKIAVVKVKKAKKELRIAKEKEAVAEEVVSNVTKKKQDFLLANNAKKTNKSKVIKTLKMPEQSEQKVNLALLKAEKESEIARIEKEYKAKQKLELVRLEKEKVDKVIADKNAIIEKANLEKSRAAALLAKIEKAKLDKINAEAELALIEKENREKKAQIAAVKKASEKAELTRLARIKELEKANNDKVIADVKIAQLKKDKEKEAALKIAKVKASNIKANNSVVFAPLKPKLASNGGRRSLSLSDLKLRLQQLKKANSLLLNKSKHNKDKISSMRSDEPSNTSISPKTSADINKISQQINKDIMAKAAALN